LTDVKKAHKGKLVVAEGTKRAVRDVPVAGLMFQEGATMKILPTLSSKNSDQALKDEKRLFYLSQQRPTEIRHDHKTVEAWERKYRALRKKVLQNNPDVDISEEDESFIKGLKKARKHAPREA